MEGYGVFSLEKDIVSFGEVLERRTALLKGSALLRNNPKVLTAQKIYHEI